MKDIPLNQETLDLLNESLWFLEEDNYKMVKLNKPSNHNEKDADYYTGREYFKKVLNDGRKHNGFPDIVVGHSFGVCQTPYTSDAYTGNFISTVADKQMKFFQKIQTTFNLKKNALFNVYPPGGYISWHNNANAAAFNLVFTYSETGDGWWEHYDNKEKKFVRIYDTKGWQCKAGYFGGYADPREELVYHTAKNGLSGARLTIAFVFDRSEMSQGIQNWVIEDIHE